MVLLILDFDVIGANDNYSCFFTPAPLLSLLNDDASDDAVSVDNANDEDAN